tara:strand:+ start:6609 stop:7775 length:1167 start_codon:yes stop_codon:yes gene_type:complete
MKFKYPLSGETISKDDIDKLRDWLATYPRLTMGELTKEFENKWANYIGTKRSIFVNSGSSANLLMVYLGIVLGKLKQGDKVIVPSCGWVTTISPVIQFGLEPIMVDANDYNYGVNINEVERLCKNEDIKGMIFVHPLGVPNDKEEIIDLKNKYNFFLMEDCCASVGAKFSDGTKIGTVGDVSSFSFYFGHQLSTIEGGFVNTNSENFHQIMLMLRSHGWTKDISEEFFNSDIKRWDIDLENGPFNFVHNGFNIRSTDLQAFLGLNQLEKADIIMKARNRNHLRYQNSISDEFIFQDHGNTWPVSLHIGILARNNTIRSKVLNECKKNGIETRVWSHGNLGRHPFWIEKYGVFKGSWANQIYERGFILPTFPELNENDIDKISSICNNY